MRRRSKALAAAALLCLAPLAALAEQGEGGGKAFRVCADPNNLPFSNQAGEGFENKLAELIAADFGEPVSYTWWAQRRGNIRNTLKAGACDVIMGVPADLGMVATTKPYYRSTYVFVTRVGEPPVSSLKDPALRMKKIGVQLIGDNGFNTPPAHALALEGVVQNVRGYTVYGDYRDQTPAAGIIEAVRSGDIDVAAVWGPLAGYFATRGEPKLTVTPISDAADFPALRFAFDIAMGVRKDDASLRAKLDEAIARRRDEIARLLQSYGAPLLEAGAVQTVSDPTPSEARTK
jgi:mxaJ protein